MCKGTVPCHIEEFGGVILNFDKLFLETMGEPINYNYETLIRLDKLNVECEFSGIVRLISTSSKWRQGVELRTDSVLIINNTSGKIMTLWEDFLQFDIPFYGKTNNGLLSVNNIWDFGKGVTESWSNGAAMKKIEIDHNHYRYCCNDFEPDEDFDDIVFDIILDEMPDENKKLDYKAEKRCVTGDGSVSRLNCKS